MVNPPSPELLLQVEDLTVERGGRIVLSRLGFELRPGETILVSGRNGAGKSTLLRTIAGLLRPVAGTIRYGRADAETRGVETVHYLGYEDGLKPSLTVGENLAFWGAMLGAGNPPPPCGEGLGVGVVATAPSLAEKSTPDPHPYPSPQGGGGASEQHSTIMAALAAYGIARLVDLPAAYLSAGQKRRVALARLLLATRPIWLLDEPLIALDTAAQATVVEIMAAHTAAGGAILVASHQPLPATREIALDHAEAAA